VVDGSRTRCGRRGRRVAEARPAAWVRPSRRQLRAARAVGAGAIEGARPGVGGEAGRGAAWSSRRWCSRRRAGWRRSRPWRGAGGGWRGAEPAEELARSAVAQPHDAAVSRPRREPAVGAALLLLLGEDRALRWSLRAIVGVRSRTARYARRNVEVDEARSRWRSCLRAQPERTAWASRGAAASRSCPWAQPAVVDAGCGRAGRTARCCCLLLAVWAVDAC
jgi:hypothetical protein